MSRITTAHGNRKAVSTSNWVTVRTDTPEHFMDDLKKYGYIKG